MLQPTTLVELNKILSENSFVVVDFYTQTCPPCKKIAPFYETLPEKFPHITFIKVDCGERNDIASAYKVGAVPTFIFFKNGKVANTHRGANEKELRDAIEKHFA
jgi:thioredoxin 1